MTESVAAVVITHNSADCIEECLGAARRYGLRVLVVDNASGDGTRDLVERFGGVSLIANATNRGFATAVNQAMRALDQELVLLLNPDAVLLTGLEELARACAEPGVAAAAGKLVDEAGRPQRGFNVRRFPTAAVLAFEAAGINRLFASNPVNRCYRCLELDPDQPAEVEQPAGAFLMIRKKVWRELGGFDEGFYPVFFEEVDFLRRAARRGYRIRYVPSAVARHRGAHSIAGLQPRTRQLYWYRNLLRYAEKHFGGSARAAVAIAVLAGAVARTGFSLLTGAPRGESTAYAAVIPLAARALLSGGTRAGPERSVAAGSVG